MHLILKIWHVKWYNDTGWQLSARTILRKFSLSKLRILNYYHGVLRNCFLKRNSISGGFKLEYQRYYNIKRISAVYTKPTSFETQVRINFNQKSTTMNSRLDRIDFSLATHIFIGHSSWNVHNKWNTQL